MQEFREKGEIESRIPCTKDFQELERLVQENKRLKEMLKPKSMKKL